MRRQQSSEEIDPTNVASKTETLEALLAQKRVYQKHLRNLQQTSLARDILKGTWMFYFVKSVASIPPNIYLENIDRKHSPEILLL